MSFHRNGPFNSSLHSRPLQHLGDTAVRGLLVVATCLLTSAGLPAQSTTSIPDAPIAADERAELDNYLLAPFDRISIAVYGEPELSASQRLTARGEITVPLLGNVAVSGLSTEDAKDKLEQLYVQREFLRAPEVFLVIDDFSPKRITILGQISSPSSFELPMGANYLEIEAVIAMAGGFTDLARRSAIRVTRKNGPDGREQIEEVNMDDVLSDQDDGFAATRFRVYPGDILYVPRRFF